ncbi:MAG: hypothetical protein Fur002_07380 [Anaerolineales bacterium]
MKKITLLTILLALLAGCSFGGGVTPIPFEAPSASPALTLPPVATDAPFIRRSPAEIYFPDIDATLSVEVYLSETSLTVNTTLSLPMEFANALPQGDQTPLLGETRILYTSIPFAMQAIGGGGGGGAQAGVLTTGGGISYRISPALSVGQTVRVNVEAQFSPYVKNGMKILFSIDAAVHADPSVSG